MSPKILQPTSANIADCAEILRGGGLVAFPTETVYGLGADATNEQAVAGIYAAKGRPRFNPLIAHVAPGMEIDEFVVVDARARTLMEMYWPGPLTLVLKRTPNSPLTLLSSAGLDSQAIRCPSHEIAQSLLVLAGRPIAAPSANRSGGVSPTTPVHVVESLDVAGLPVLAGGKCTVGLESTVLDLSEREPVLLRHGAILKEELEDVLGVIRDSLVDENHPKSPGQLLRHYAPSLPIRLNADDVRDGEALIGFGPVLGLEHKATEVFNLSETGDLVQAAANLFAALRALDNGKSKGIAVMPVPNVGLGVAINDRLHRAATDSGQSGPHM